MRRSPAAFSRLKAAATALKTASPPRSAVPPMYAIALRRAPSAPSPAATKAASWLSGSLGPRSPAASSGVLVAQPVHVGQAQLEAAARSDAARSLPPDDDGGLVKVRVRLGLGLP